MSRHIIQGSTGTLTGKILDASGPVLLESSVITIVARSGATVKSFVVTAVYTGSDPTNADVGKWTYDFSAIDSATPGVYRTEAKVVNGANIQYFPEDPKLRDTITITADLT